MSEIYSAESDFQPEAEDERYYGEIMADLDRAREVMPEQDFQKVNALAKELQQGMKEFKEIEQEIGALPEVWEEYRPRHQEIQQGIQEMATAYKENLAEERKQKTSEKTTTALAMANEYFQQEREQYLARETKMQQELEVLRQQMAELQKAVQGYTPEKLAECLAVSTQFLKQVEEMRGLVKNGQGEQQRGMHKAIAGAVNKAYMSIKEAPARAKKAVRLKVYKAADTVIQRVAGAFDRGIDYLERKKEEFLNLSPMEIERQMEVVRAREQQQLAKELEPELVEGKAKQAAMTPKEKAQARLERTDQGKEKEKAIAV